MDKSTFLSLLKAALEGEMPLSEINGHISYYDEYFTTEMRKGKSEYDIASHLGDPRLIAKTIIETSGYKQGSYVDVEPERTKTSGTRKSFTFNSTTSLLLLILIIILIPVIIFKLIKFAIALIPIALIVFVIVKVLNDNNRS